MPLGRIALAALFAATLHLPGATPLAAQRTLDRSGLTVAFGVGAGNRDIRCTGCEVERESGAVAYLLVGGTLSPRLVLGGEINGWGRTDGPEEQSIASLMAVAHFYPAADRGLYLAGGAGLTSFHRENDVESVTSNGYGLQLGAGYDVRVASGFSLTPYVQWVRGFGGDADVDGESLDLDPDYLQVGLGFTWH